MKQLCLLCSVLFTGLLLLGAGCGGDPNVEGAKLALTLNDINYDEYIAKLDESISLDTTNAEAYFVKGQLLQKKAEEEKEIDAHIEIVEEMAEAYRKALELEPLNYEVQSKINQAYNNEFNLGIAAHNRGREDKDGYYEASRYFGSSALIQPDSSGSYVNQAFSLFHGNYLEEAIMPLEMALEKGAKEIDLFIILANVYEEKEQYDKAIEYLKEATELYPENENLLPQLINIYAKSGKMEEALLETVRVVELDPENALYRYNLGTMLLETDKFEEAVEQFAKAIELNPEHGNAHFNLGVSYVNRAVEVNEEITQIDDDLRANRSNMSASDIESAEDRIRVLAEEREEYYQKAIGPLEEARRLFESQGEDASDICSGLFQAYVQTDDAQEKIQDAADCAGIELN